MFASACSKFVIACVPRIVGLTRADEAPTRLIDSKGSWFTGGYAQAGESSRIAPFSWGSVMALALATEAEDPPAGRFIMVDGARLHYIDRGTGTPVTCCMATEA